MPILLLLLHVSSPSMNISCYQALSSLGSVLPHCLFGSPPAHMPIFPFSTHPPDKQTAKSQDSWVRELGQIPLSSFEKVISWKLREVKQFVSGHTAVKNGAMAGTQLLPVCSWLSFFCLGFTYCPDMAIFRRAQSYAPLE